MKKDAAPETTTLSLTVPASVSDQLQLQHQRKWQQTAVLVSHPSLQIDFLITDCPDKNHLDDYSEVLRSHRVSDLFRICEPSAYLTTSLEASGISVHEMYFDDGTPPTSDVVKTFRSLISNMVQTSASTTPQTYSKSSLLSIPPMKPVAAVHCVSGIGRAPVLVCCALVDGGVDPVDAVEYIRKRRRGAINKIQLAWILDERKGFKRTSSVLKRKDSLSFLKGIFSKRQ
ncbi:hypothetical protein BASA61_000365 [Batrachochytrium salamandrivorans]|nr:hypothetical protein BASA62_000282 [Batrachochytrium salamandrivorans]KAH6560412.1 hypothetical protein BASA60_000335 [Batrachochytrium salamandrivorans]KAH6578373.1 hypothetical protein BASA61_000365 [Batrachochytrium salamandrivorans]KAH9274828.1 hypothetical protein BASA83_002537 [Batrachochytrium salamandrivorans]